MGKFFFFFLDLYFVGILAFVRKCTPHKEKAMCTCKSYAFFHIHLFIKNSSKLVCFYAPKYSINTKIWLLRKSCTLVWDKQAEEVELYMAEENTLSLVMVTERICDYDWANDVKQRREMLLLIGATS